MKEHYFVATSMCEWNVINGNEIKHEVGKEEMGKLYLYILRDKKASIRRVMT